MFYKETGWAMKYRIVFLVFAVLTALLTISLYLGMEERLQILLLPIVGLSTVLLMHANISRHTFSAKNSILETLFYLLITAGLFLAIWQPGVSQASGREYVLLITCFGVVPPVLWRIAEGMKGFALPAFLLTFVTYVVLWFAFPAYGRPNLPGWAETGLLFGIVLLPACILTLGGYLIYESVREHAPIQLRRFGISALLFALSLGFFGFQIVNYRLLDTATDSVGAIITFFMLVAIVIVVAFIMGWRLGWYRPLTSQAYAFSVIIILFAAFSFGEPISPVKVTEKRAERINRALVAYQQAKGRYPEALQDLSPKYLLYVPRQVIIPSEGWCYQGGLHYYRFGFVEREYFSMPAKVTVFGQAGSPPESGWDCEEIAAKYPGY